MKTFTRDDTDHNTIYVTLTDYQEIEERLMNLAKEYQTLERKNARLWEVLRDFYQAIRERHHGRMPDEVEKAYNAAADILSNASDDPREAGK